MEDKIMSIPYIVYEGEQARNERTTKRFIIALIIAIALLFLSNAAWLLYFSSYEFIDYDDSVTVDAKDGIANYIGNTGDILNYGTNSGETQSQDGG